MSLEKSASFEETIEIVKALPGFEQHVVYCCRAPEFELRKWLIKTLSRAGFVLYEDNYKTERAKNDKRYDNVHNLVAIRGENAEVCLVAHTDVCREHEEKRKSHNTSDLYDEYVKWNKKPVSKDSFNKLKEQFAKEIPFRCDPAVKVITDKSGDQRRIVQDRTCKFQVGGDDRLGVAINTWIALNTGYDMGLYFPTDEEIGLKSARACEIPQLKEFELLVQVDRGNKSNELVIKIGSEILCDYDTAIRLIDIAYNMGKPRSLVQGMHTDVYALKSKNWCKNAVNMTCGYHNSIGADPTEYIDMEEARDTLEYVSNIVKDYSIDGI